MSDRRRLMEMSPNSRFPRALAVWLVLVPTLLVLTWLSGHLYWQIRIGRAMATLEDPATDQALIRLGSRGIPRFVDELERALSRGDDRQARAITRGLLHLIAGAYEIQADQGIRADPDRFWSREEMEHAVREYRDMPPKERAKYPRWWMWWRGRLD
jgi:hypothetical protein